MNQPRLCSCGRPARHQRTKCNTCRSKIYGHPLLRLYRNLKASAKRRHKEFSLDRDAFVRWIVQNGYAIFHGRYKKRLHIDRIDPRRGYVWGNVQVIPCSANCRKRWTDEREAA
jgi:hypothetical protein